MHDSRDNLDRLLDSALAAYADPGPDSGLESRIVSRIALVTPAAPRHRLPWAIALPVAAILLLFTGLSIARQEYAPRPASQQGHISPQSIARPDQQAAQNRGNSYRGATSQTSENRGIDLYQGTTSVVPKKHPKMRWALATEGPPHSRRAKLAAQSEPLPKLDIFPTPQPLSPQEQALVDFAAQASLSERESLLTAQQQADAPLHIAAIEIKPLEPPALGPN